MGMGSIEGGPTSIEEPGNSTGGHANLGVTQNLAPIENQSVSSLAMGQLQGIAGYKILQYIRSDQFGQYGESNKLYDIIQVSDPIYVMLTNLNQICIGIHHKVE